MFDKLRHWLTTLALALSLVFGMLLIGSQAAGAYGVIYTPQDSCFPSYGYHECTHYYCASPNGYVYVYVNQVYYTWTNWTWVETDTTLLGPAYSCTSGHLAYYG